MQATVSDSARPDSRAKSLAWAYATLVVATVGLMVLGALVRAHGAGLACPDWPLCFGEVIPELNFEVAFEFGHRVVAGGVGLTFLGLWIWTSRQPELLARVDRLLPLAALLLAGQALLGALTVWLLLARWTVTAHLVTANLFVVTLTLVALRLHDARSPARVDPRPSVAARATLCLAAALLSAQIVLGGLVSSSYAGMACPEWPACLNGQWFPAIGGNVALHLLHRTGGYAVLLALAAAAFACRGQPGVRGPASGALALGLAQVTVGISNVLLGIPVEVTALHSLLAACMVLTLTVGLYASFGRAAGS